MTTVKTKTRPAVFAASLLIALLLHPAYRARAAAAWEILFNGSPSQVELIQTDTETMLPVYFELPEAGESATFSVHIERDAEKKRVKVTKLKKRGPFNPRGDCPKCTGSKKCQGCYPAGSGLNTAGNECYSCNATGDCPYCKGSGECYTCDGRGFPNGCNTCGDVSKV